MVFPGNKQSPEISRYDLITSYHRHDYEDCSEDDWQYDQYCVREADLRGDVELVHVDEDGRPYLLLNLRDSQKRKHYVEVKEEEIKTYTSEELELYKARLKEPNFQASPFLMRKESSLEMKLFSDWKLFSSGGVAGKTVRRLFSILYQKL